MPDNIVIQNIRQNQYQLKKISALTELTESYENLNNILNNSYLLITNQEMANNYKIKCSLFLNKILNKIEDFIEEFNNTSQVDIVNDIADLASKIVLLTNKINNLYSTHNIDIENLRADLINEKINILSSIYTKEQIDGKYQLLELNLTNYIDRYFSEYDNNLITTDEFNGVKNELTNLIEDKVESLSNETNLINDNLQSQIDLVNSHLLTSFYTKEEINRYLYSKIKGELNEELSEYFINMINEKMNEEVVGQITNRINQINNDINTINNDINTINNDIDNIESELNTNNDTVYSDSRIDKLEAKIKYLEENGGFNPIDPINRIEWVNYSIVNPKSQYIIKETFEINKGNVIVYYNDNTYEDITNQARFNISGGSLSGNNVTIGTSEGNFNISVSYNSHNASDKISYKVISPKYYNYFLLVDDTNMNNIYDFTNNISYFSEYYINRNNSGCPMIEGKEYNALSIITEKFYNNVETNLRDEHLYLILPKAYCTINDTKLYVNNTKPLKTNIFEISGISIKHEITVNEPCYNIQEYNSKSIVYYILEISDSINNGIQLKY